MESSDTVHAEATQGAPATLPSVRGRLLVGVDLAATFLFALEGAMTATEHHLDFFGVLVLSFATALCGGIVRDLLIGAIPPNSIRDPRYPVAAFVAAPVVFFFRRWVLAAPPDVLVLLDAAGLSLFAVAGCAKALDHRIAPFMAVLMGTITGVGGGTIRDLLLTRVPGVLRVDIYAVAALTGAATMVVLLRLKVRPTTAASVGAVVCFVLRMVSYYQHWNLPVASE